MKTISLSWIGHLLVAVFFLSVTACSEEDSATPDPTEEPEATGQDLLVGTWSASAASLDGTDVSADFADLVLTISESLEFTTNGNALERQPNPWTTKGTFTLDASASGDSQFRLLRDDGLTIDGQWSEEGNTLELDFTYAEETANGRKRAVGGDWSFTLTK